MAQFIAILILATWAGFFVYLLKTIYIEEKYWARTKFGLWLTLAFSSFMYTLGTCVAAFLIFAIGAVATGFIH